MIWSKYLNIPDNNDVHGQPFTDVQISQNVTNFHFSVLCTINNKHDLKKKNYHLTWPGLIFLPNVRLRKAVLEPHHHMVAEKSALNAPSISSNDACGTVTRRTLATSRVAIVQNQSCVTAYDFTLRNVCKGKKKH